MLRLIKFVFFLLVGLALLVMAGANRDLVTLRLLPADLAQLFGRDFTLDLPLFVVIFAGILAGLLIGFVWEWLRETRHRSAARTKGRDVVRLERELAVLRDATSLPKDDVLAILDTPASARK